MCSDAKTADLPSAETGRIERAFSQAFLIRAFERRLLELFSEGLLFGTVHTCIGQEFSGIAVAAHLQPGDLIFTNHRGHGHYLARTGDVAGLMAEIMGRTTGICGGRGGSQHMCAGGVFSNGVQGGIAPVAAGLALAQHYRHEPSGGVFHRRRHSRRRRALRNPEHRLEVATPAPDRAGEQRLLAKHASTQTLAGDIVRRAEAFGIAAYRGNTWEPEGLIDLLGGVMRQIRQDGGPAFVQVDTYRLKAHSKGDDDRSADELQHYWAIDPLTRFEADHPEQAAVLREQAETAVSGAVNAALDAPFASNPPTEIRVSDSVVWQRTEIESRERVVSRIHEALRDQLANDSRAFLLGEDIEAPYGGAFKVTRDLSLLFPGRVRNTPLSEAAIVGIGNGMALAGLRPICEIMFGDFLTLAADQIVNQAAKFQWMYNGQVDMPLIIRTPMGGRRGYGPTHSQSLEKHFLGIPGTRVLALHQRFDPYVLYQRLFSTIDRPTIVIENKSLYAEYATHRTVDGFWCEHSGDDFPTTRIRCSATPDITIVCYGGMLPEAEKALDRLFEEHEVVAEIVCPAQIYPLRIEPILDSVRLSGRLLVVEEGQVFCGFGAEVLAAVHEGCPDQRILARRQGASPHPIPSCKPAEMESLPGADTIVRECIEMVSRG